MTLNVNSTKELMVDPHHHKEKYLRWNRRFVNISKENEELLLKFMRDMEIGRNVTGKKGKRGYGRLNTLKSRMHIITKFFEKEYNKNLIDLTDEDVILLFEKMRDGTILKSDGGRYKSIADYVKIFKSFWHWYMRVMRMQGKPLFDIMIDLDSSREKPEFNTVSIGDIQKLLDNARYDYKLMMMIIFDTGVRAPTELFNLKGKDFTVENNVVFMRVRYETTKTFERRIKLLVFSEQILRYAKSKEPDEFLFKNEFEATNQYIKRLGYKVLNIGKSEDGGKTVIGGLGLYDFRHSASKYFASKKLPSHFITKRFGWKNEKMLSYYTNNDYDEEIDETMMIDAETSNKLQRELDNARREITLIREQMIENRQNIINSAVSEINKKLKEKGTVQV